MSQTETIEHTKEEIKIEVPKMYKVLLHNDDFTTMEFVIAILVHIFHRSVDESVLITTAIHETGIGVAGAPYTREIAEEKARETMESAQRNGHPLKATFEPV